MKRIGAKRAMDGRQFKNRKLSKSISHVECEKTKKLFSTVKAIKK